MTAMDRFCIALLASAGAVCIMLCLWLGWAILTLSVAP